MTEKAEEKHHPVLRDKKQIAYYYDVVLPQLAKYQHATKSEWVELLTEQCIAEGNFDAALTDFLNYIQQEGLELELDPRALGDDMQKLSRIRFLRKMINAMGLGLFEEDIIREEIVKLYRLGGKGAPTPASTRKKKE